MCVVGFSACSRQTQPSPQTVYEALRLKFQHGELIEAQAEADRAYQDYADHDLLWAWRFRVLQAEILIWRGMNDKALVLLDPELPLSLSTDEVAVRRRLLQSTASPYPEAKRFLDEAEHLPLTGDPRLPGEIVLMKGNLSLRNNDLVAAENSFQEAILIAHRESQPFLEARALGSLGIASMQGQHYGEAIDRDKAALAFSESIGARALVAKIMGNLGWCYYRMGDLDTALKLFTDAEALSAELGLQKDQVRRLVNLGIIHWDKAELEEAQNYYLRALTMAKELEDRQDRAMCLNNLALIAIEKKQFDDAELYNRESLDLERGNKDSELYALFTQAKITEGRGEFEQAKTLLQQVIDGSSKNFSLRWIAQARLANIYTTLDQPLLADQEFRKSLGTINQTRASLNREDYKLTFLSSVISFYDDYVSFLLSRKKVSEALHVVELNRARTLTEGLGLKQNTDSVISAEFRPEEIAKRTKTVILSYRLSPGHSHLWAITSSQTEMFELPPQSEIDQTVHSYRAALAGPRDVRETSNPNGQKLYEMLVAPAQKFIPENSHVIIIPDGSLYELNFETLLVRKADQLHYWIEDVVVTNASSLLLLEKATSKEATSTKNMLLIGDPVSPSPQYTTLPQAASEISQVKKYFPADQVQIYEGKNATAKAYLESNPERFSFIHFVAHGVASRESPLDSAVILSGDESSYKLYARDILARRLQANLVTISSCEGAGGRTYAGEGLVGLSWAFLYAGAHQVIAALWEVNDAATPEFMHQFYAGISAGSDPAVALRAAKLSMLNSDGIYRKPFYWAPFQLYQGL